MSYTPLTVAKSGSTKLKGDITLSGGTNVTLTQSAQNISIAATGGGGAFARVATKVVGASNAQDTTNVDYLCTGSGDQSTINTAIGALPSGGGRIVLSDGLFTLSAAIVVNKSNVIIEGQGNNTKIQLANATNLDCVQIGDGVSTYTNIVLKNLLIDGNMANQTTAGTGINFLNNTNYCVISGCTVQNTYSHNIIFTNVSLHSIIENNYLLNTKATKGGGNVYSNVAEQYGIFKNNYCTGADGAGLNINGNGDDTIEGNSVFMASSGGWAGIYLYLNSKAIGNYINSSAGNAYGIYLQDRYNQVEGNLIITPKGTAISSSSGLSSIVGNFIKNPAAVSIVGTAGDVVVGNNIYIANNPSGTAAINFGGEVCSDNLVYVDSGNTAAVTAISITTTRVTANNNFLNFLTGQAHVGITSTSGYTGLQISNNFMYFATSVTGATGMSFSSGLSNSLVANNLIVGGPDIGADFSNISFSQILNNVLVNVNSGFVMTGTTNTTVSGNLLFGNNANKIGMQFATSATHNDVAIVNNTINGFGNEGLYLGCFQYGMVSNNKVLQVGQQTTNTYAAIFLTDNGSTYSIYNTLSSNSIRSTATNKPSYGIRENGVNDGPNIVTSNIVLNAVTAQISTQNASSDVSHNITT